MKLKDIINKLGNYGFYMLDKKITVEGETFYVILEENMPLLELFIKHEVESIKEQFGDIELEKVSDTEYKEKSLD